MYVAGWHRRILIQRGRQTAKYLSRLTAKVLKTDPTLNGQTRTSYRAITHKVAEIKSPNFFQEVLPNLRLSQNG